MVREGIEQFVERVRVALRAVNLDLPITTVEEDRDFVNAIHIGTTTVTVTVRAGLGSGFKQFAGRRALFEIYRWDAVSRVISKMDLQNPGVAVYAPQRLADESIDVNDAVERAVLEILRNVVQLSLEAPDKVSPSLLTLTHSAVNDVHETGQVKSSTVEAMRNALENPVGRASDQIKPGIEMSVTMK